MGPGGKTRKEIEIILQQMGIVHPQLSLLKKLFNIEGEERIGDQIRFYDKFIPEHLEKIIHTTELVKKSQEYYVEENPIKKSKIKKEAYAKIDEVLRSLEKVSA